MGEEDSLFDSAQTMGLRIVNKPEYARIEELLRNVYKGSYTAEHLNRFKAAMVDDAKVFDDAAFMKTFPMNDKFWNHLLPGQAAKADFFQQVNGNTTTSRLYSDV